jgi:hypothetical protein
LIPKNSIRRLAYAQLFFFVIMWFLGIYINGFVPGSTSSSLSFLLTPLVSAHFALGIVIAIIGGTIFSLALKYKFKRCTLLSGLALVGIVLAAIGGLCFVFGIGNQNIDSMLMAVSFVTALYLTFLAILSLSAKLKMHTNPIRLTFAVLIFFYITFMSGIYANLFVASQVFSESPAIAEKMLGSMVVSPPMLLHETSGTVLFALVIALTILLYREASFKIAIRATIATLLVGYSLYEGITMNIFPILQGSTNSVEPNFILTAVAPLSSAAGFLYAIIICMSVLESLANATKQTTNCDLNPITT